MTPDATDAEASVSTEVDILISMAPEVVCPIIIPLIVKVNAVASIVAPDVVITTDASVVALQVALRPGTLLAPKATVGVTAWAKKPKG